MRQTLFFIPAQIGDIPLFGFGLIFWGIVFLLSILALIQIYKKGITPELGSYVLMGGIGAVVLGVIAPNVLEPEGFPIRGYGFFLLLAILLSSLLVAYRGKKRWNMPADTVFSVCIAAIISGIAGARLFYVTEYWYSIQSDQFLQTIFNIFDLSNGGLVVYGSIIGGVLGVLVYLLIKKLPILATLDLLAPALLVGIAVGRLGCLMNGCCFGGVCDLPWAITFPDGSPVFEHQIEHGETPIGGFTLDLSPLSEKTDRQNSSEKKDRLSSGSKFDISLNAESEKNRPFNSSNRNNSSFTPENVLFPLKAEDIGARNAAFSPVIVASVVPGSSAEKAGLKPGMIIKELNYLGKRQIKRTFQDKNGKITELMLPSIQVRCNNDVLFFIMEHQRFCPDEKIRLIAAETAGNTVSPLENLTSEGKNDPQESKNSAAISENLSAENKISENTESTESTTYENKNSPNKTDENKTDKNKASNNKINNEKNNQFVDETATNETADKTEGERIRFIDFVPEKIVAQPVHPTQIYSSLSCGILGLFLLLIDYLCCRAKRLNRSWGRFFVRDGFLFLLLMIVYPLNRFALEMIRTDEASFMKTGLSVSQCISLSVLFGAMILAIYIFCRPPRLALDKFFPAPNESVLKSNFNFQTTESQKKEENLKSVKKTKNKK